MPAGNFEGLEGLFLGFGFIIEGFSNPEGLSINQLGGLSGVMERTAIK